MGVELVNLRAKLVNFGAELVKFRGETGQLLAWGVERVSRSALGRSGLARPCPAAWRHDDGGLGNSGAPDVRGKNIM